MSSRPKEHEMRADDILAYLRSQRRIILVSNGVDGYPHAVPMNFILDDSARIVVTTYRKSQKVKNLQRDPRATLLVESGSGAHELKSVIAYADAEIVDQETLVAETLSAMANRALSIGAIMPSERGQVLASAPKRVVLRFKAKQYISWDHSKLRGNH